MEDQIEYYIKNFIKTGETGFIKNKNKNNYESERRANFILYSKIYEYLRRFIIDEVDILQDTYNKEDMTYNIHYARWETIPDDE